jgi:hypothetical protein
MNYLDRYISVVIMSFLMMFVYSACVYWSVLGILLICGCGSSALDNHKKYDALFSTYERVTTLEHDDYDSASNSDDDHSGTDPEIEEKHTCRQAPVDQSIDSETDTSEMSDTAVMRSGVHRCVDE